MARIFVTEDGSGVTGATSYCTLAEFDDYFDSMGYSRSGLLGSNKEVLLNKATRVVDAYALWDGQRVRTSQGLQWPRTGVCYPDGLTVPSNAIPKEIKNAVFEVANADHLGTDVQPINQQAGNLASESVKVDVIAESKSYFEGSSRDRDEITALDDALAPLLGTAGSAYGSMPIVRV